MGKFRKKLSVWAAVFMTVAISLSVFSAASVPAAAAELQINWYNGETETEISVEKGEKFYIGDFVSILGENISKTASLVKASYKSQRPKIASVSSKGYLSAKSAGTTDISVSYQGETLICHLTVVKKGTFDKTTAVKKLQAAAKTLSKGMPAKLTAAKGYTLKKKKDTYLNTYKAYSMKKLAYDGFLYEQERPASDNSDYKRSEQLAVPQAGRYLTAEALLRQFLLNNNPTSIKSKKTMRIASAAASSKTNKITIKLTKSLTADQIFAAQLAFPTENSTINSKTKANIIMSVYDETAREYYRGELVLKKGSRQFTVNPVVSTYGGYEKAELVKGHVYMLESKLSWANGTKITAK